LLSESDAGFTPEDVLKIQALKVKHGYLVDSGLKGYRYVAGQRPWAQFSKLDVALPCATQNEVSGPDAEALVKAGVKYVAEGSNMVSVVNFPPSFATVEGPSLSLASLGRFGRDRRSKRLKSLRTPVRLARRVNPSGTRQARLATQAVWPCRVSKWHRTRLATSASLSLLYSFFLSPPPPFG
jgi:hypothetical protein